MIAWIPCSEPLGQSFQSGEVRKEIRLPRAIRLRAWTAMDNQWFARLAELPLLARQQLSFMQGCSGCFRALTPFAFGGLVAALALGTQARMDGPQPRVSGRTEGEVDGGVDVGLDDGGNKAGALHPIHDWHEDRPARYRD